MKVLLKTGIILGFCCSFVPFSPRVLAADPLLYAITTANDFGTLDPVTGTFSFIGNLNNHHIQQGIVGMGFGADGNLYALDWGTVLYQVNTGTGAATLQYPRVGIGYVNGLGMTGSPDGTLYVYAVKNPSTRTSTLIGSMGYALGGGSAFDAAGDMYMTKGIGTEQLYSVNPTTGAATFIGNTGTPDSYAIAFEASTLYLVDLQGGVWTADPTTGASTQISTYNGGHTYGSIVALYCPDLLAVPEPSSFALAGLGTATLLIVWRANNPHSSKSCPITIRWINQASN